MPFPVPLLPELIVIHELLLTAVHKQEEPEAVTVTLSLEAVAGNEVVEYDNV